MLSVYWEGGASEGLSRARSQWSSTPLLFNALSLHCILRYWHIKIKLLDPAQNLHLYAKIKCFFLAEKNVQICHRTSNLELAWMNCVKETIMVPPLSPSGFASQGDWTFDTIHCFHRWANVDLGSDFLGSEPKILAQTCISFSDLKLGCFIYVSSLSLICLTPMLVYSIYTALSHPSLLDCTEKIVFRKKQWEIHTNLKMNSSDIWIG